jgi:hypothetical protein
MNNQPNANGGASPELQPMMGPPSNDKGGQGPAVDGLTGPPVPGDVASEGGAPDRIKPDSVKTGHD